MSIRAANDTFTSAVAGEAISFKADSKFNILVDFTTGTGVGTVALQMQDPSTSAWVTVESYTADTAKIGESPEDGLNYRLNCTALTSGTIEGRLSQ